jgi:hypothetical protein
MRELGQSVYWTVATGRFPKVHYVLQQHGTSTDAGAAWKTSRESVARSVAELIGGQVIKLILIAEDTSCVSSQPGRSGEWVPQPDSW